METNEVVQTNNAMEEQVPAGLAEVDEPKLKARKPRIGIKGGRQTWVDCVGEIFVLFSAYPSRYVIGNGTERPR